MSKFTNSKRRIVVAKSGWVWCGIFSQEEDSPTCYFDDAYCIRVWGAPEGLGQLCEGPLSETILDPVYGRLSIHEENIVMMFDVDDVSWENYGSNSSSSDTKEIHCNTKYFKSNQKIVIIESGWVLIGKWRFDTNTRLASIDDAYCIKNWGTKRGLGEICNGPTNDTDLNKISGLARAHEKNIIATYEVDDDAWNIHWSKLESNR
jgi:hypothetical protein